MKSFFNETVKENSENSESPESSEPFNIETLNFGVYPLLQTSFIKFDVAIATFKNLLKIAVLEERLNKTGMEKVG